MLRHVAMFRWSESTTPDDIAEISEALVGLPDAIPEIRDFRFGSDAGINVGAFDFAVVADFDNVDDYLAYRDSPVHAAVATERIIPHVADRVIVQYEC